MIEIDHWGEGGWDYLERKVFGVIEICFLIGVVATCIYISVKMLIIVHLEGVHFTTGNLYLDNIDLK